ncbi:hypothetical protein [Bradyrhizobium sp. sBnM-33]|uniref:hypothetical protein n=1 Tax=Bradyrhizobium sp. sBnM-33 TaxID=2831780 RepID=UPI001BCD0076|nr:hypothetical protein [Bradyrhizobium sp. sBnM-33]WOH53828.1 hypothetical protein RX328_18090 [Bradyrhizobium sp. sBnM-33]
MAEASRVHSTPPLSTSLNNIAEPTATYCVDTSRRRFLSQAAAVTVVGAALATAPSQPGSAAVAGQAPDPILEAIETHKATSAKLVSWVDRYGRLEDELPAERRRSDISNEEIVETDDPRWIEGEREVGLAWNAETAAAWALLEALPTKGLADVDRSRRILRREVAG